MSIFTDRRTLAQIGGLRAYLRQVSWSLRWQFTHRRRLHQLLARLAEDVKRVYIGRGGR